MNVDLHIKVVHEQLLVFKVNSGVYNFKMVVE